MAYMMSLVYVISPAQKLAETSWLVICLHCFAYNALPSVILLKLSGTHPSKGDILLLCAIPTEPLITGSSKKKQYLLNRLLRKY